MRACWLAVPLMMMTASAHAGDPSALWKIVSQRCVPHQQQAHDPSPCSAVDVDTGYVVLKDIKGVAQYLVMPTARRSGIEDPAILATNSPNLWEASWNARSFVEGKLQKSLPRDGFALAINSPSGRSQDQLHIHVDCIRPDVRAALASHLDSINTTWTPFPLKLAGHSYRAIRIDSETLHGIDPFQILARDGADLSRHTLVLVGETFPDGTRGFALLDDTVSLPFDRASGEELEDHDCAVAGK